MQIAGFQRHGGFREQNHGGRGVLDDAARGVHGAHRRDSPALIDGFEFMARHVAQRRVIAYQKNRVFPGCHVTIHCSTFLQLNVLSWQTRHALRARAGCPKD